MHGARYMPPAEPGDSATTWPESLADHAFPHGRVWATPVESLVTSPPPRSRPAPSQRRHPGSLDYGAMPAGQPLSLLWPDGVRGAAVSRLDDQAIADLHLDEVVRAIVSAAAPPGRLAARERFARDV